nr:TPA_inf: conotoxin precursor J [Conus judaeus]
MASVQSVTCCCFLWLMLSVQLITPSPPGTAHLPRNGSDRDMPNVFVSILCYAFCTGGIEIDDCDCSQILDLFSQISRKRSMAM